jgi:hypothetical protein
MTGLFVWYVFCAFCFAWWVYEPKKRPARNVTKEWLAQIIASSDPLEDFLYDTNDSIVEREKNAKTK